MMYFIMGDTNEPEYGEIFYMKYWKDPVSYMHHRIEVGAPSFSFGDVESFEILFDKNILIPGITILRIDNGGIVNGHYLVHTRDEAEGLLAEFYGGRPGMHSIVKLIEECPEWSPNPVFFPEAVERTMMGQCRVFRTVEDLSVYITNHRDPNPLTDNYLRGLSG